MSDSRKHLVESAGYWYKAAHNYGVPADSILFNMDNAYNHVENALGSARRERDQLLDALVQVSQITTEKSVRDMARAMVNIFGDRTVADEAKP